ncbi:cytochrome C1 family-domain-containing protein [Zopfochytrium polystomum]|nr:cytochrome C1 family-domain-containing protein [Zopfochytrium polystomum]
MLLPGGAIAMTRAVYDEVVDYEDGTPNNASQTAKDVSTFLAWASYPQHDERKKMGMKRFKWTLIKPKKLAYRPSKDPTNYFHFI